MIDRECDDRLHETLPKRRSAPDPYVFTTGRICVVVRRGDWREGLRALRRRVESDRRARHKSEAPAAHLDEVVAFEELGVAYIPLSRNAAWKLLAEHRDNSERTPFEAVDWERLFHASTGGGEDSGSSPSFVAVSDAAAYVRGYRDGVADAVGRFLGERRAPGRAPVEFAPSDNPFHAGPIATPQEVSFTWGLQVTGADRSPYTGLGVRVAILDTGFTLRTDGTPSHPDFAGRRITAASFVPSEPSDDMVGHGTHCAGTACGPRTPAAPPGYGVAPGAEIFAGKVLGLDLQNEEARVVAGIAWAIQNSCRVISMSLGAPAGSVVSPTVEAIARRAIDAGAILVAASGNASARNVGIVRPVDHPANCPSVLAVTSLEPTLAVSNDSNGPTAPNKSGGEVNFAAPGSSVQSAWPVAPFRRRLSGTSQATPHVAGIAALYVEKFPGISASDLVRVLAESALHPIPTSPLALAVGAGVVRGPLA